MLRRPGLRASVTTGFALSALVLSVALALGTYLWTRHLLIEQRERAATRQAFTDAALVRDALQTSGAQVSEVLGTLSPPAGTLLYVHRDGRWYSSVLDVRAQEVTSSVREAVERGEVARGWTGLTNPPGVVVGVPLSGVRAEYYEVAVAAELDQTLDTLRVALAICAVLTTIAGAVAGRYASRQLLTPLRDVAEAATSISHGNLKTRLGRTDDPDLAALVGSFNTMVDALDARIERDARFAADVAHELRTPLTTLTNCLSLLRHSPDQPGSTESSSRAVELMDAELRRFTRALEDLVTLGRLDADVRGQRRATVSVGLLVRQALTAGGRDPSLLQVGERPGSQDADCLVKVDRQQLIRTLTNLFDNADIHGQGLTAVRVLDSGETIEIHVQDDGPGVPVDDRERIFERFARAGVRQYGTGSGLGLSIVAQTVHQHGGTVHCETVSSGGTDMVVRLPRTTEVNS